MSVVIKLAKSPERARRDLDATLRELTALYNDLPAPPARETRARVMLFPGVVRREPCVAPASAKPARPARGAAEPVRSARGATQEEDQRKSMLAKIHIAKKDLMRGLPNFTDATYRFILEHNFGVLSAADLSNAQLHGLLIHFASLGWQAKHGRHRKNAPKALTRDATRMGREELMGKIEAMLAEKGRAEGTDAPWGYAVTILKNQTAGDPDGQIKSFDKASPRQLAGVIAALYRDAKRKRRRTR